MTVTATSATSNSKYGAAEADRIVETDEYDLTFLNPCIDADFVTLTIMDQTDPPTDTYTSEDITFTYNPFTVVPSFCAMTIKCNNVAGPSDVLDDCQELNDGKLTWNFTSENYHTDKLTPGDYVYTFDVSTGDLPGLTK